MFIVYYLTSNFNYLNVFVFKTTKLVVKKLSTFIPHKFKMSNSCFFFLIQGNYGATAKTKQKELDESYKKNTSFNKDEEKIANEKSSNEIKFNKLILLESQNQEKIHKRNRMIVETANLAGT